MSTVERIYAFNTCYRVVYMNGLEEPMEALIGTSGTLVVDDAGTLDEVCQFIQQSVDLDCRHILFMYREPNFLN